MDSGADFLCSFYDVAFGLCEELRLPLVRCKMKIGWYRNGLWITTTPGLSAGNLIRNLPAARAPGFLSPRAIGYGRKLFWEIFRQSQFLSFASDSQIAELDDGEGFGNHPERVGVPENLQASLRGFFEMTMGHVEFSGQAYMRTYTLEMFLNGD